MVDCVELLNKIASASDSLSANEPLTQKLADQIFSPCYKCESINSFSVRHTFNLGEWFQYDSFDIVNVLPRIASAVQSDSFLQDFFTVLPLLDRTLLRTKIDTLCQSLQNARI